MVSRALISKYILDILYGNFCPSCAKAIRWDELVCSDCGEELEKLRISSDEEILASRDMEHCDRAVSLFYFQDICRENIYKLKSDGEYNFAEYSAKLLCSLLRDKSLSADIDIVTAVPMSRKRHSQRGYNHAELLAKYVAGELGKTKDFKLLRCENDNALQHHLSAEERKRRAVKIYRKQTKHRNISGKTILLCDDVLTTGATMNSCAKILREMGADKIICASVAVTKNKHNGEE